MTTKEKDITYYAIMYGGVPMTAKGALSFMVAAVSGGFEIKDCVPFIPIEYLMPEYAELKRQLVGV